MVGRAANPKLNRRTGSATKFFLALGLGVFALYGFASGQDDIDPKSPLPPTEPTRPVMPEKYQIDKNSAIFKRLDPKTKRITDTIVDLEPIAAQTKNPDEYQAWTAVVQHAKQFTAAELEQHGSRDLTRDDLAMLTGVPSATDHRLGLYRFDGKLVKVRRVEASQALKLAGTAEVYEALFVPLDEPLPDKENKDRSLAYSISVVFTELPESLAAVKQQPPGEWLEVDQWATAVGYFFKVKQDAPGAVAIPVLVGKSITVLKAEPVAPGPNPAALEKDLRVFRLIKDDDFRAKAESNWAEVAAWNRVLLHARRFMPEDLERYATGGLTFADLFLDGRRDFKLDLVKFEGRLILLTKVKPSEKLLAAGVETAYEGWIVPKDDPSGHPICVFFTDPPEGIEPTGRVNKWVSFAGYSFKLLRYESGEQDKKDQNKHVVKRAPLLLGRAVISRTDPESRSVSWSEFVTGTTLVIVVVLAFALGVSWWFRRGDRVARQEIKAHRSKNPFGEQAT